MAGHFGMYRSYDLDEAASPRSGNAGSAVIIVLATTIIGSILGIMIATQDVLPGFNEKMARLIPADISSLFDDLKATISKIVDKKAVESQAEFKAISTGVSSVGTIHYSPQEDSTQMIFDLKDMELIQTGKLSGPHRVYVDLQDIQWEQDSFRGIKTLKALDINGDLVNRVRIKKRESGVMRIVLDLKRCCDFTYKIPQESPSRLIVHLQPV